MPPACPLNLEVTPAIGRPHRVMEVGGHLYVALQPAGAPPALALDRVLAGLQRSIWIMVIYAASSQNRSVVISYTIAI